MDFSSILDGIYTSLNQVRISPREAVHNYSLLQKYYNGNLFKDKIKTRQGVKALRSLLDQLYLRGGGSSNKLMWSYALHMAADQQASKLGQLGILTTQGTSEHVSLPDRCKQYGLVRGRLSQVYQFGGKTPNQVLQWLLIDDGLASRKRRNTLLDPIYKYIGIGSCFHESYGTVTVIILAQEILSLVAPDEQGKYRKKQPFSQGKQTVYKIPQQIVLDNIHQIPGYDQSLSNQNNMNKSRISKSRMSNSRYSNNDRMNNSRLGQSQLYNSRLGQSRGENYSGFYQQSQFQKEQQQRQTQQDMSQKPFSQIQAQSPTSKNKLPSMKNVTSFEQMQHPQGSQYEYYKNMEKERKNPGFVLDDTPKLSPSKQSPSRQNQRKSEVPVQKQEQSKCIIM